MRYVYVHVSRGRERWEKGVAWVSATVGSRTVARGGKRRHATCPYLLVVWPRIAAVVAQRPEEFTLQAAGATATATTATASTAAAGGGGSSHSKGGLHDRRQIELWWHVERRIARVCLVLPHAREREKRALHADGGEERRRRSEGGMRESHEGVRAAAVELDAAGVARVAGRLVAGRLVAVVTQRAIRGTEQSRHARRVQRAWRQPAQDDLAALELLAGLVVGGQCSCQPSRLACVVRLLLRCRLGDALLGRLLRVRLRRLRL